MDPELAALQVLAPRITLDDIAEARELERTLAEGTREPRAGIDTERVSVTRDDRTAMELRIYRPADAVGQELPVLLFIHGGSFVTGGLHSEDNRCELYAHSVPCAVVAVDYRLAPEFPFPIPFEDCLTALRWIVDSGSDHRLDTGRIAVAGLSAGGCLAAAVALKSREHGWPDLVAQMLLFPVLDARRETQSVRTFHDTPILTSRTVDQLWPLYLGAAADPSRVSPFASPALATDLSGAPPALIVAAQLDPLRDEAFSYAERLLAADVPVEMHHYAGVFHAFDSFASSRLGRLCLAQQIAALHTMFA
jgi:acetyl esterase/lipase